MEPTTAVLGYAPLAVAAVLPVLVIWDSSIRRSSDPSWPASVQLVLGVGMLLFGTAAVGVSVSMLASYSLPEPEGHLRVFLLLIGGEVLLGLACVATLTAGLAWPARPVSRRGFTTLVLIMDLAIVVLGVGYSSMLLPVTASGLEPTAGFLLP